MREHLVEEHEDSFRDWLGSKFAEDSGLENSLAVLPAFAYCQSLGEDRERRHSLPDLELDQNLDQLEEVRPLVFDEGADEDKPSWQQNEVQLDARLDVHLEERLSSVRRMVGRWHR